MYLLNEVLWKGQAKAPIGSLKRVSNNLNRLEGARLADLRQVLPSLSENQVQSLLRELRAEKFIHVRGKTKAGLWFLGKEFLEVIPK
jgi:hypothetical protein